jgi:hypothetical protein
LVLQRRVCHGQSGHFREIDLDLAPDQDRARHADLGWWPEVAP